MQRSRQRPSIRLSAALQQLVIDAGDSSAALKALLVLGGRAAGLEIADLPHEARQLLAGELSDPVRTALSDLSQTGVRQVSDRGVTGSVVAAVAPVVPVATPDNDDPFAALAIDV